MKSKPLLTLITLAFASMAIAAPKIEPARIDSMVKQFMQQNPVPVDAAQTAALRKQVEIQLQSAEILKDEALKVGLDKNRDVQIQLKNLEAQFYAAQYASYLESQVKIDENELRTLYDNMTRVIQLQQVRFKTAEEAKQAQQLLLKGLSFEDLMKHYPNPDQQMNGLISTQQLPPEIAQVVNNMVRGEVSREPVAFNGEFYLLKIAVSERSPEAPPFEQAKGKLIQQAKQEKAQAQIIQLLKANGITQP